jgi:hypothetical protein
MLDITHLNVEMDKNGKYTSPTTYIYKNGDIPHLNVGMNARYTSPYC